MADKASPSAPRTAARIKGGTSRLQVGTLFSRKIRSGPWSLCTLQSTGEEALLGSGQEVLGTNTLRSELEP